MAKLTLERALVGGLQPEHILCCAVWNERQSKYATKRGADQ